MGEIKLDGKLCERCEHTWVSRNGARPIVCPKCKSPYWDVLRQNGVRGLPPGPSLGKNKMEVKEEFGLFPNSKNG